MFDLTIGTTLNRKKVAADENKTPAQLLAEHNIDIATGSVHFNGATLSPAETSKPIKELLGSATAGSLIVSVKADAA